MSARAFCGTSLIALLLWAMPLAGQTDFDAIEIRTTSLGGSVYMLMGSGGNIGLSVGEDGAFIVDDQFAPLTEKIKAAIAEVTDRPVEWVLNTHWHGDHTGGNENFGGEGALIVAHDNVYRRMNPAEFADLVGRSQQAPEAALPVVTFNRTITLHWNGETIHAFHVEHAHTDGDVCVLFPRENVLVTGGVVSNDGWPVIDWWTGGWLGGMLDGFDTLLAVADENTRIVPGNGPVMSLAELRSQHEMYLTIFDRLQTMLRQSFGTEEVLAAAPTAEYDAAWGDPEQFLTLAFESLWGHLRDAHDTRLRNIA